MCNKFSEALLLKNYCYCLSLQCDHALATFLSMEIYLNNYPEIRLFSGARIMNTDGIQKPSSTINIINENSKIDNEKSAARPAESEEYVPKSSPHHPQDSPSLVQREIKPQTIHLCHGQIGGDPSSVPDLPSLEECLDKLAVKKPSVLSNSEKLDLFSGINEKNVSILLTDFFINPILNLLNYRVLEDKHNPKDECIHLAAAMCNVLEEEYEDIVDCCATFAHTLGLGFSHPLQRFTESLTKLNGSKNFSLYQARQNIIDGLKTDRQTLVEKIAHREIERVNTILQQDSSIEDKYKPVGNLALIFLALSANNIEAATHLFQEACFKDADGNSTTPNHPPPVYSKKFTTAPTNTYQYVYYSVGHIKDITHLQRLVDQIKNHLIPNKGATTEEPESKNSGQALHCA